jgi:hypothetical protein
MIIEICARGKYGLWILSETAFSFSHNPQIQINVHIIKRNIISKLFTYILTNCIYNIITLHASNCRETSWKLGPYRGKRGSGVISSAVRPGWPPEDRSSTSSVIASATRRAAEIHDTFRTIKVKTRPRQNFQILRLPPPKRREHVRLRVSKWTNSYYYFKRLFNIKCGTSLPIMLLPRPRVSNYWLISVYELL